jgi:Ca-activated chloride channel family protein
MGNYNDVLMEQLADKGDGHYAYVDTLSEARRVFVEQLTGTLELIARNVKVQVEFDPGVVRAYRLIGYENRDVADDDFRDEKVDGGEVGAGHAVTALYELKLWPDRAGRIATAVVRYKPPEGDPAREVARSIATTDVAGSFERAEASFRLAAAAAEFAEILRGSYWARGHGLAEVAGVADGCRRGGGEQVGELVELIDRARRLRADAPGQEHAGTPE